MDSGDDFEELRLALVLNGGVSLAVWIGGAPTRWIACSEATSTRTPRHPQNRRQAASTANSSR